MERRLLWRGLLLLAVLVLGGPARGLRAEGAAQTADSLKITEVYYDTPGSDGEEEWIELANFGSATIDLTQFK
ncbi:MAG: hypothetical protein WAM60_12580, partial [Candidatus Promineifilaceae bacterium]